MGNFSDIRIRLIDQQLAALLIENPRPTGVQRDHMLGLLRERHLLWMQSNPISRPQRGLTKQPQQPLPQDQGRATEHGLRDRNPSTSALEKYLAHATPRKRDHCIQAAHSKTK
jgi:hypothetical protein